MVHMCKRIISPGAFLHFCQILIFGVNSGAKRVKNGLKWQKIMSASTSYLSKHTPYDRVFLLNKLKILVLWVVMGGGG